MSTYGNNKANSKYDSHKKSELRDVSNNIKQSNSKAPVYKVDLSESAQKFAIDVKENALTLSNVLGEINGDGDHSSFKKMAFSSDTEVLEAKFIGDGDKEYKPIELTIQNLATPQVNTGNYINPKGKALGLGKYSFDLNIANVTYEFQFTVGPSDTNRDVQEKLSRLINKSNVGLVSGVGNDSIGNSALIITSNTTGTIDGDNKIFSISNNGNSQSDVVKTFGMDRTTALAQDAHFTVNGEEKSSTSNEFSLGKSYMIKLKSSSDEVVNVGLKADTDSMIDNIRDIVSGYNSIIDLSLQSEKPVSSSEKLYKDFATVVNSYKKVLAENGLDVTDKGYLEVNSEVLNGKSEDGSIGNTMNELKKFSDTLQNKADSAVIDPMTYANKIIVSYKNPNAIVNVPYETSAYSGMMFNGYI